MTRPKSTLKTIDVVKPPFEGSGVGEVGQVVKAVVVEGVVDVVDGVVVVDVVVEL